MLKLQKEVLCLNKVLKSIQSKNKISTVSALYSRIMAIVLALTLASAAFMVACTEAPKGVSSVPQPISVVEVDTISDIKKVYGSGTVYNFDGLGFFYIDEITQKYSQIALKCDAPYQYIECYGKGEVYGTETGEYKMVYSFPADNRDGLNILVSNLEGMQIHHLKTQSTSPYIIKGVSVIEDKIYIVFEDMVANSYFAETSFDALITGKAAADLTYISDVKTIYNDFVMLDNQTGFLTATLDVQVAYPVIYRTIDGGKTWTIVSESVDMSECKLPHEYYTHDTYSSFAHSVSVINGKLTVLTSFSASGEGNSVGAGKNCKYVYERLTSTDNGATWQYDDNCGESDLELFSDAMYKKFANVPPSYDSTKPFARDNLPLSSTFFRFGEIVYSPQTHFNYDLNANTLKYRQQVYQQFGISSTDNNDIDAAIQRLWKLGVGMYNHGGSFVSGKGEMVENPNGQWGAEYVFFIDFDAVTSTVFTKAGKEQLLQQKYFSMDEDSMLYIDKISGEWAVQSCRHSGWGGSAKFSRYEILSQTADVVQVRVYCKSYDFNGDYHGEHSTDIAIVMEDGVWKFDYISDAKL